MPADSLSLSPTKLFTGEQMLEGVTVHVSGSRIVSVTKSSDGERLNGLLAPGFIDIQVNGGGGVMFNDSPDVATLATITSAHRRFGVTGVMATLISDDRGKTQAAIDAVASAMTAGVEGLLGLHLEGPWLSTPKRGVHPAQHLRAFDDADLALLARTPSFPVLTTVAPEQIDARTIGALRDAGVTISLGHTAATADQVEAALDAGAAGFTHLFNAMPPLEGRNPGPVGAALARRDAWAGLILDGIHVDPVSARAAFAAKTAHRLILVSDAMATVGAATPSMSLFGETISVAGGALRTSTGTLAGAHLDLSGAVRNAVALLGASVEEALRMASLTPAEFLGLDRERGRIAPGCRADFVLLDPALAVVDTWIAGKR